MNMRLRFAAALALSALAPLALAGCQQAAPRAPLTGSSLGGPFTLVDESGRTVTQKDYAGRYRTMYFGYSFCPDVCPTDLQKLMAGYHAFAAKYPQRAAKLVPIFVTIDPARDTPAVLKQYTAAFGPELVGLTGTPTEVKAAAKAYGAFYQKVPAPNGAEGYLMDHSRQTILYGPDGQPITLIPTDESGSSVEQAFEQWVR